MLYAVKCDVESDKNGAMLNKVQPRHWTSDALPVPILGPAPHPIAVMSASGVVLMRRDYACWVLFLAEPVII